MTETLSYAQQSRPDEQSISSDVQDTEPKIIYDSKDINCCFDRVRWWEVQRKGRREASRLLNGGRIV